MIKRCFKCQKDLPRSEFYRHQQMADGLLGKCKACTRTDMKRHRLGDSREAILAYDRSRSKRPERRAAHLDQQRKQRAAHPEKYKARASVQNAIRSRRLIRQPCRDCGSTIGVEGHHPDYSKPLDVEWLCEGCHRAEHQRVGTSFT